MKIQLILNNFLSFSYICVIKIKNLIYKKEHRILNEKNNNDKQNVSNWK